MLRVVLVTAPAQKAEELARRLLDERLIACANLLPAVHSLYWWGDEIQSDTETLMLLKTRKGSVKRLFKRLKRLHPYDVPEMIALQVEAVFQPYDRWVARETKKIKPNRDLHKAARKKKG